MKFRLQIAMLIAALMTTTAFAETWEWPQWRGPARTDISRETGLLKTWPEGGPQRVWLFKDAGIGYSGFAVVDGRLFTMGAREGTEYLMALNANTGEELWSVEIGELLENGWGNGPRATPTVDGELVYAMSGRGNLICANTDDGKISWQASMTNDLNGKVPNWATRNRFWSTRTRSCALRAAAKEPWRP